MKADAPVTEPEDVNIRGHKVSTLSDIKHITLKFVLKA